MALEQELLICSLLFSGAFLKAEFFVKEKWWETLQWVPGLAEHCEDAAIVTLLQLRYGMNQELYKLLCNVLTWSHPAIAVAESPAPLCKQALKGQSLSQWLWLDKTRQWAQERHITISWGWVLINQLGTKKLGLLKASQDCPGVLFPVADSRNILELLELFLSGMTALRPLISEAALLQEAPDPPLFSTRIPSSSNSHVRLLLKWDWRAWQDGWMELIHSVLILISANHLNC